MPLMISIYQLCAPLYVISRMLLANYMPLSDCDEVYNYWEPLHFLIHEYGMQTWEYAHEYALRTYAYLVPWQYLSVLETVRFFLPHLNSIVVSDKLVWFCSARAILAGCMGVAEVIWLYALHQRLSLKNSSLVVGWTSVVLWTSTGMASMAGAYLPSATYAMCWLLASAAFLLHYDYLFVILAVTVTLATGWPFGVVVLVPMGMVLLGRTQRVGRFLAWILFVTIVVQGVVTMIDYQFYGTWTFPTYNIFAYNAAGGGDALYGVEPISYYVKNLLLQFNIVAPMGLLVGPILLFSRNQPAQFDLLVVVSSLYALLAITITRPHKEERFLFPIYPVLVLAAVLVWDHVIHFLGRIRAGLSRHKELRIRQRQFLHAMVWIPCILLSMARTMALSRYYTAPLRVYAQLAAYSSSNKSLVCTCGEWHRFPSSFALPDSIELAFLPSSFTGQLPQPFSKHGSKVESQELLQPFNDRNRFQPERLVELNDCDFVVDLVGSDCAPDTATLVYSEPFLKGGTTIHRILYLPILHERAIAQGQISYYDYGLYRLNHDTEDPETVAQEVE